MKIFVIGGGGREHALIWKLSQNPDIKQIYVAPGNGGMDEIATRVHLSVNDGQSLLQFAKEKEIDLTVVGPEAPLAAGIVDLFEKKGLKIFGPSQRAALLEGSKVCSKEFIGKYEIPTADFLVANTPQEAMSAIERGRFSYPFVIKADGLAAGKGVIVVSSKEEAVKAVEKIMVSKEFGGAGERLILEEFLTGQETSFMVFSDGKRAFPMVTSKDYKRRDNGNEGPNTGGMGAISPSPFIDYASIRMVMETIIMPTVFGMAQESRLFKGVLYAGLMMTPQGPKVLEFNCRFGDPETQTIMLRLQSDLLEIFLGIVNNSLSDVDIDWSMNASGTVVLASGGYPERYETGKEIYGLSRGTMMEGVQIFHAGTEKRDSKFLTSGGRVLNVCATAPSLQTVMEKIYTAVSFVSFEGMNYRNDIGVEEKT